MEFTLYKYQSAETPNVPSKKLHHVLWNMQTAKMLLTEKLSITLWDISGAN